MRYTKDEAMDFLYKYSNYFEKSERGNSVPLFIIFFENEEDYQKIDEGQLNDLFWEKRLVVWQSYDGDYHYKYYPDND